MGRFRVIGRAHRIANIHHQKSPAGYSGGLLQMFTGAFRQSLYSLNSRATGRGIEDDYEVDYSDVCFNVASNKMRSLCANAGQESLIEEAINNADYRCIIYKDYDPSHTQQPDEAPDAYISLETSHPEACSEILLAGIEAFYEEAERLNL